MCKKEGLPMKATSILRKVDNLGRIVISKETRKISQGDAIIQQKYTSHGTCPITGDISANNVN